MQARSTCMQGQGTTSTVLLRQKFHMESLNWFAKSKRFVPGSLVGIKDIDFVGRSEAETP